MLSTAQAAKLVGVSQDSIRRYARDGLIPAHRVGKRLLRFRRDDLIRLISKSDKSA
ncbi:helix-turn-helix domain-containing protein [Mycolicibacterium confluentis]|nr:helix-turn-helix domain-containing protein [Mycolicibacterium confluentis]MCV7317831.1 helix-turn-helix domain-containing protein [Mycolicibacterium confluentis]